MKVCTSGPLSGIKVLRSVSKGTRDAVHMMIKGFTLELGGSHEGCHPDLVKFLQTANLISLRINVSNKNAGEASRDC